MLLGAAPGATHWEPVHRVDDIEAVSRDDLILRSQSELRATIPYAGIFCAFSSPDVEDTAAVRFHLFTMPELPRDDPSSLRVHLCPVLPDQEEEMHLADSAEWGAAVCVASSAVLYLCEILKTG